MYLVHDKRGLHQFPPQFKTDPEAEPFANLQRSWADIKCYHLATQQDTETGWRASRPINISTKSLNQGTKNQTIGSFR
jgi:hypothetical protein